MVKNYTGIVMDGDPPGDYRYYNTDNGWPQVPRENWLDTAFSYIPFFGKYNKVPLGRIDLGAPSWPLAPVTVTKKLTKEQWRNIAKKREQEQKDKNRKLIESINLGKKQFDHTEKRDAITNQYDKYGGFDNYVKKEMEAQAYAQEMKKRRATGAIMYDADNPPSAKERYIATHRNADFSNISEEEALRRLRKEGAAKVKEYNDKVAEENAWYQPKSIRNALTYTLPFFSIPNFAINPDNESLARRTFKVGTSLLPLGAGKAVNAYRATTANTLANNVAAMNAPTWGQLAKNMAIDIPLMWAGDKAADALISAVTPYNSWGEYFSDLSGFPLAVSEFFSPGAWSMPGLIRSLGSRIANETVNHTLGNTAKKVIGTIGNTAKTAYNNYRYPLGEPVVPEGFNAFKPKVETYSPTIQEPPAVSWGKAASSDNNLGIFPLSISNRPLTISWEEAQKIKPLTYELDWSPEGWFGTRKRYGYTYEDIKALSNHLPEYRQIERQTKADGTWLRMPDGSTWTGDPRSWVQLMSKDGRKLIPERWFNGVGQRYVIDTPTYIGEAWLGDSPTMAENWAIPLNGGEIFELTYPVSAKVHRTNANGNYWHNIPNREGIKSSAKDPNFVFTDDILEANINRGYDVTRIDNVIEGMSEGLPMTDVVIHPNTPRKSILGNNGNFDLSIKNIYKGLVPFLIGGTARGLNEK